MAVTGIEGLVLLLGRVLFGGVIAVMGINHFMQTDQMTGYLLTARESSRPRWA